MTETAVIAKMFELLRDAKGRNAQSIELAQSRLIKTIVRLSEAGKTVTAQTLYDFRDTWYSWLKNADDAEFARRREAAEAAKKQ